MTTHATRPTHATHLDSHPHPNLACRAGLGRHGRSVLVTFALAVMLVVLPACEKGQDKPAFKVHNRSGQGLKHLVITDAGPVLNYSRLGDGDKLIRKLPGAATLPKTVNVYWEDLDGTSHHQYVELWKRINSSYQGTVKLTLQRNGSIRVSKA